jgi:hypothetical protein
LLPLIPRRNCRAGEEADMHIDVHISALLDAKTVAVILWIVAAYLRSR